MYSKTLAVGAAVLFKYENKCHLLCSFSEKAEEKKGHSRNTACTAILLYHRAFKGGSNFFAQTSKFLPAQQLLVLLDRSS